MNSWKTELFFHWFSVWDPGRISSSAWSNLHSCLSVPRRVSSLWGHSAFLVKICQILFLKLIQLTQENPTFWLTYWGCITCLKPVKTALKWKESHFLSSSMECGKGTEEQLPRPKDLVFTATHYHQGSELCLSAAVLIDVLKSRSI